MRADWCGMVVNYFKLTLHLSVAFALEHNVVGVNEVRCMDVRANLNP